MLTYIHYDPFPITKRLQLDSSYYIKACIEDSCAMRRWEGKFDPKCGVVSAYTSACRVLGLQIHGKK